MKKVFGILMTMVFFLSCTSNTIYEKPKDLIPKDSMILLLKDLYIANAARSNKNNNLQRKVNYTPLVYQKYGIDSSRFQRSNFYYTSKIDVYEPMLKSVVASLEEDRSVYAEIKKRRDSIKQDSIKKSRKKLLKMIPEKDVIQQPKSKN
ncbi:DUF4296 domain-containing protein [Pseudotenacibaculum sp. MALMAid0570]|uniref:DUF4296 domain-containing protein n=1 Tax=Pseudotenacibaculum sp. MALMAid0570 TaxID=3143938 RepID=UPI0032DF828E